MTAPRVPLFQRKGVSPPSGGPAGPTGKPALTIAIHGQDRPEGSAGGPDDESVSPGEPATCPACGCVFDPATGEIQHGEQAQGADQGADPGTDAGTYAPPTDGGMA